MFFIILALVILTHALIGIFDFSFYRIPNLFLGLLVVLYGLYAPIYLDFHAIWGSLIIFAIMLVISFSLYALKIIGAGDAKYIAVASLWAGTHGIVPLLFFVSLAGAAVSLIYLFLRNYIGRFSDLIWIYIQKAETDHPKLQSIWVGSGTGPERGKRENIGPRMIPYGIAIATGSIIMLMMNPIIHR